MLDEVGLSNSVVAGVVDEVPHHVHLVVAWEEKSARVECIVRFAIESHEVLDDVGETFLGKDFFPEVGGLVSVWV